MTRIFDALRKAEASRPPLAMSPAPAAPQAREHGGNWGHHAAEAAILSLPLLGGVELSEDALRATSSLRVNIESALPDRALRSIMFASAQGGEGTSTVTLQFAQALAAAGARVVVMDAHARRPAVYADESQRYAVLDARVSSPAMAGVMTPGLFAVPATEEAVRAGQVPAEIVRAVLQSAAGAYDWLLLDGPPVVESPDAASLAAQVDGVVLVLHAGRAKRPVVSRAVEMLRKSGGRVLGTVLNRRVHEIPGFIYRRI